MVEPTEFDTLMLQNKPSADGKPGTYSLRFRIDCSPLKPRRVVVGLKTNELREARLCCWAALNALRQAGVSFVSKVRVADGRWVTLNDLVTPLARTATDAPFSGQTL